MIFFDRSLYSITVRLDSAVNTSREQEEPIDHYVLLINFKYCCYKLFLLKPYKLIEDTIAKSLQVIEETCLFKKLIVLNF